MKPHEWAERPLGAFPWDKGAVKFVTPAGKLRIFATDIQDGRTHFVTREYNADGTSQIVNFGHVLRPKDSES